jgi:hypothetical protein
VGADARGFKHTRQPPDTERWGEKRVLAAIRIVRSDQQNSWRWGIHAMRQYPAPIGKATDRKEKNRYSERFFGRQIMSRATAAAPTSYCAFFLKNLTEVF